MLFVRDYKNLAPYHVDTLVSAINKLLSRREFQLFTKRTLRFYIAQGIIPPAKGPTKFARYGYEHLLGILAARVLQTQGMKLDQIQQEVEEIKEDKYDRLEAVVMPWLQFSEIAIGAVFEKKEPYNQQIEKERAHKLSLGEGYHRFSLTPNVSLEVTSHVDLKDELPLALSKLSEFIKDIGKNN